MPATGSSEDFLELLSGFFFETGSETPDDGEDEDELELVGVLVGVVLVEDGVEDPGELLDEVEVGSGEGELEDGPEILAIDAFEDEVDEDGDVFLVELWMSASSFSFCFT